MKADSGDQVFLTARWENLILITYKVTEDLLLQFMPPGMEADTIENSAFISLVAFDFLDTRVKGIKFPFHVNFPEINLRFYVKNSEKRGVVFIREFVPKAVIPLIANNLYNENYKCIPMKSSLEKNSRILLNHTIKFEGKEYQINIDADNKPFMPPADSAEHFFKEHEWGFGISKKNRLLSYRVEHPFWEIYPVKNFEHNFDFSEIYGKNWDFLNGEEPFNVTFAKGSGVKVCRAEY